MNELITRPDIQELTSEATTILTEARSFKIATNVSYQLAAEELQRIKGAAKRLEVLRKSITDPMNAAKQAVMDFFTAPQGQLTEAETQIKGAMSAYQKEVREKEAAAQREAEAAATAERERAALAAAKAAEEGRHEDAQLISETAAHIVAMPVAVRAAPKVAGINVTKVWKFEITDVKAVPREYCIPDEAKIRKIVQALKGDADIAGIRIWSEDQISSRAS